MRRNKKLSAPASEQEIKKFVEACEKVEMQPADTLRKLAHAFVLHVNQHGSVAQPIRLEGFQHGP